VRCILHKYPLDRMEMCSLVVTPHETLKHPPSLFDEGGAIGTEK